MKKESSIEVGSEGVQGFLLARAAGLLLTDKIRKVDLTDKCLYSFIVLTISVCEGQGKDSVIFLHALLGLNGEHGWMDDLPKEQYRSR